MLRELNILMSLSTAHLFSRVAPAAEFCSLRIVHALRVRQGVVQPIGQSVDRGAMVTVIHAGACGYAATADLSVGGLRNAIAAAKQWAALAHQHGGILAAVPPQTTGHYRTPVMQAWASQSMAEKLARLRHLNQQIKVDDDIVDWEASLWCTHTDVELISTHETHITQEFDSNMPRLSATANDKHDTQTRTFGGHGHCRQVAWSNLMRWISTTLRCASDLKQKSYCTRPIVSLGQWTLL